MEVIIIPKLPTNFPFLVQQLENCQHNTFVYISTDSKTQITIGFPQYGITLKLGVKSRIKECHFSNKVSGATIRKGPQIPNASARSVIKATNSAQSSS